MIVKIFKAFLSAFFWGRSLRKSSRGSYHKSLELLDKSINFRGGADFEMLLRKGYLLGALGRDFEAVNFLREAVLEIEGSQKISLDEKKYLKNYAASLVAIMKEGDDFFYFDEDYNQEKVGRHFVANFPYSRGREEIY